MPFPRGAVDTRLHRRNLTKPGQRRLLIKTKAQTTLRTTISRRRTWGWDSPQRRPPTASSPMRAVASDLQRAWRRTDPPWTNNKARRSETQTSQPSTTATSCRLSILEPRIAKDFVCFKMNTIDHIGAPQAKAHQAKVCEPHARVFGTWCLGRLEIFDLWCLGGSGGPETIPKCGGLPKGLGPNTTKRPETTGPYPDLRGFCITALTAYRTTGSDCYAGGVRQPGGPNNPAGPNTWCRPAPPTIRCRSKWTRTRPSLRLQGRMSVEPTM